VLEREIVAKKEQLNKISYEGDNWKEQLSVLQEENETTRLRKAITLMRNSLFRLRRQERLARLKSETDVVEMEVLRHNYASKLSSTERER
jgi:heterodisulfide reductase subunit A-like polyferredoxin